ncbi:radical SAM protein [Thermosipho melanesiensis]|uniref:Biotin synthetase-like protein n=2 Tax=Thermosipho melanesiensis TaxID=46541 RepID=A6LM46_THEM4|nr:radical SAM protein [Thermosipho melanesiensis]ABR30997.1 biotin synthetase-like protein [Thermosipho melanesiensis BI429]APT74094.1 radical SAM protein [Thermosipho melanesiensis]OOC36040.1 radical SAM protein [Thermosipho melanesiensis]OOC36857.1 radical SAM protein [Thermosipho melanesiensis]OOC37608.1 radical SAM protein [Thermosipho melanesiensis]
MVIVNPSGTLPITVTKSCPINCKHCGGVYIKSMVHIDKMENYVKRYKSFLISGGMSFEGKIPFDKYIGKLEKLKKEYNLLYNFHIGFPKKPPFEIEKLADVISFDFFSDENVMKEIYRISRTPKKILDAILPLKTTKIPHITVGIYCGRITHEIKSLEILKYYFDSIVLNIFIPTKNTEYEKCLPPKVEDVKEVFELAKKHFKNVTLGCMHPHGKYRENLLKEISPDIFVNSASKIYDFKGCCSIYLAKEETK